MFDKRRAIADAENGSMVAQVALMAHVGLADHWPEAFRETAVEQYTVEEAPSGSSS